LQQALTALGADGREGFVQLLRNVLASVAAPDFDVAPLLATLDALAGPAAAPSSADPSSTDPSSTDPLGGIIALLASARDLLAVVATLPDGSPAGVRVATLSRLAGCVLAVDPDGYLAGYIFDVVAEAQDSLGTLDGLTLSPVWLEILAYAADALAHEQASRDALGQALALLLRPDLAMGGLPELIGLLESQTLAEAAGLLADLSLAGCLEAKLDTLPPGEPGDRADAGAGGQP